VPPGSGFRNMTIKGELKHFESGEKQIAESCFIKGGKINGSYS
jgi:hypothetical protein